MSKFQHSFFQILLVKVKVFFRHFPAVPYILKWLFISCFIGLLVGSASAGFLASLQWATELRTEHLWLITLLPIGGFIIGALYHYYGKEVEAGNNMLIEQIQSPTKAIPLKMAPFVYLGTIVTHLFGGSAGREGTALQMAASISDQLTKLFKLNKEDRVLLLIAAVAAGFGSVFGTPLAGALFGLEFFLIGRIQYNAIFPAFTAAILADFVTKSWQVPHTHYQIAFVPELEFMPVIYSIIAGIAFGICAAIFSTVIHKASGLFKAKIAYAPLRPFIGGIIVVLFALALGSTKFLGLGIPTIVEAFDTQLPPYDFALKMAFTIITLSAGFKGGEVTPLFFIGATLGNALSYILPLPTGLLSGMGFVALFAGATNTPLACLLMGIELFGAEGGVYIGIACVVAYLCSGHHSIYSMQRIGQPKHRRFSNYLNKTISNL